MEKQTEQSLYEILETMGEALEHLQSKENQELRQMMQSGRLAVAETLERELGCSLEGRIDMNHLSDEDWIRTAYRIMGELADPFKPKKRF